MGAILYLNDRISRGIITGNVAIGGAPHSNMAIDVAIGGAPYGSMAVDVAIGYAPHGSMPIDVAIGGAPHSSVTIDVAIRGAPHGNMAVDVAIRRTPCGSRPICIANGCDRRRIYPVFNKVELQCSFFAAAELAEGAVTARFFLVGLYEGNTWVKEFVKHMAHSDLEVG